MEADNMDAEQPELQAAAVAGEQGIMASDDLLKVLEMKNSEIEFLVAKVSQLESSIQVYQAESEEAKEDLARCNEEISTLRSDKEAIQCECQSLQAVITKNQMEADDVVDAALIQLPVEELRESGRSENHRMWKLENEILKCRCQTLEKDLSDRAAEVVIIQRESNSKLCALQGALDETTAKLEVCEKTCCTLELNVRKSHEDSHQGIEQMNELRCSAAQAVADVRKELLLQIQQTVLYRESAEGLQERVQNLTDELEQLQSKLNEVTIENDNNAQEMFDNLEQCQKTLQERDGTIKYLWTELSAITNAFDGLQPSDSEEASEDTAHDTSVETATVMIQAGWSRGLVYAQFISVSNQLQKEKEANIRLHNNLNALINEIEKSAPALKEQHAAYYESQEKIAEITSLLEKANKENSILLAEKQKHEAEKATLEQSNQDLSSQVQTLLQEVENLNKKVVCEQLYPPEFSISFYTPSQEVITKTLITFKNIKEMQQQNKKLVQAIRALANEKDAKDMVRIHETSTLKEELKQTMRQLEELRKSCVNLKKEVLIGAQKDSSAAETSTNNTVPLAALNQLKENFEAHKKDMQNVVKKLQEKLGEMNQEACNYKLTASKASCELDNLTLRYKTMQEEFITNKSKLLNERKRLKTTIHGKEQTVLTMKGEVLEITCQLSSAQRELRQMHEENVRWREAVESQMKEISYLEKQKKHSEGRLIAEVDSMQKQIANAHMQEMRVSNLENQLQEEKVKFLEMEASKDDAIHKLNGSLEQEIKKSENIRGELENLHQRSEYLQKEKDGLHAEVNRMTALEMELQGKYSSVEVQNVQLEARLAEVEQSHATLMQEGEKLKAQKAQLRATLSKLLKRETAAKSHFMKNMEKLKSLQTEMDVSQIQYKCAVERADHMEKLAHETNKEKLKQERIAEEANAAYKREVDSHAAVMNNLKSMQQEQDRLTEKLGQVNKEKHLLYKKLTKLAATIASPQTPASQSEGLNTSDTLESCISQEIRGDDLSTEAPKAENIGNSQKLIEAGDSQREDTPKVVMDELEDGCMLRTLRTLHEVALRLKLQNYNLRTQKCKLSQELKDAKAQLAARREQQELMTVQMKAYSEDQEMTTQLKSELELMRTREIQLAQELKTATELATSRENELAAAQKAMVDEKLATQAAHRNLELVKSREAQLTQELKKTIALAAARKQELMKLRKYMQAQAQMLQAARKKVDLATAQMALLEQELQDERALAATKAQELTATQTIQVQGLMPQSADREPELMKGQEVDLSQELENAKALAASREEELTKAQEKNKVQTRMTQAAMKKIEQITAQEAKLAQELKNTKVLASNLEQDLKTAQKALQEQELTSQAAGREQEHMKTQENLLTQELHKFKALAAEMNQELTKAQETIKVEAQMAQAARMKVEQTCERETSLLEELMSARALATTKDQENKVLAYKVCELKKVGRKYRMRYTELLKLEQGQKCEENLNNTSAAEDQLKLEEQNADELKNQQGARQVLLESEQPKQKITSLSALNLTKFTEDKARDKGTQIEVEILNPLVTQRGKENVAFTGPEENQVIVKSEPSEEQQAEVECIYGSVGTSTSFVDLKRKREHDTACQEEESANKRKGGAAWKESSSAVGVTKDIPLIILSSDSSASSDEELSEPPPRDGRKSHVPDDKEEADGDSGSDSESRSSESGECTDEEDEREEGEWEEEEEEEDFEEGECKTEEKEDMKEAEDEVELVEEEEEEDDEDVDEEEEEVDEEEEEVEEEEDEEEGEDEKDNGFKKVEYKTREQEKEKEAAESDSEQEQDEGGDEKGNKEFNG